MCAQCSTVMSATTTRPGQWPPRRRCQPPHFCKLIRVDGKWCLLTANIAAQCMPCSIWVCECPDISAYYRYQCGRFVCGCATTNIDFARCQSDSSASSKVYMFVYCADERGQRSQQRNYNPPNHRTTEQ